MASVSNQLTLLFFILTCPHGALFSFIMCFCHLWNSVAVYQSRPRFKLEAIYHFLVLVRREFHYGCSLQRTWKNAPKVKWLETSAPFCHGSQMALVEYSHLGWIFLSLVYISSQSSLTEFAQVMTKWYAPCRASHLHLAVHADRFPFISFKYPRLISMRTY